MPETNLEYLFADVSELKGKIVAHFNGNGTEGVAAIRDLQAILLQFQTGAKATGNDDGDAWGTERGLNVMGDMLGGQFFNSQRQHFARVLPFWLSCVESHRRMAKAIDGGYRIIAC